MSEFKRCEAAGLKFYNHGETALWAHEVEALLERQMRDILARIEPSKIQEPSVAKDEAQVFRVEDASPIDDGKDIYHITHDRVMAERIAKHFNRILAERGVRVYGNIDPQSEQWSDFAQPRPLRPGEVVATHTALLIDVRPIAPADTAEGLLREFAALCCAVKHSTTERSRLDFSDLYERTKRLLDAQAEKREK